MGNCNAENIYVCVCYRVSLDLLYAQVAEMGFFQSILNYVLEYISVCDLLPEHPTEVWAWSAMIDHL